VIVQGQRPVPRPGTLLGSIDAPSQLAIVGLRGAPTVKWVEGAFNPVVEFGAFRHQWSPDGASLAVLGTVNSQPDSSRAAFVVTADGSAHRLAEGLSVSALAWSAQGKLVVRATASTQTARFDWWSVPAQGAPKNLTDGLPASPAALMRTATGMS